MDVKQLVKWVKSIPEEDWPKMADDAWRGWGEKFMPLALDLTKRYYPGCVVSGVGMFVLEPGQVHPAHKDVQPPEWITRVHIPIVTNPQAFVTMDDGAQNLKVGKAYKFNTLATHAVSNEGKTPRLHFVFDIRFR